jgi:hypothetical protein
MYEELSIASTEQSESRLLRRRLKGSVTIRLLSEAAFMSGDKTFSRQVERRDHRRAKFKTHSNAFMMRPPRCDLHYDLSQFLDLAGPGTPVVYSMKLCRPAHAYIVKARTRAWIGDLIDL